MSAGRLCKGPGTRSYLDEDDSNEEGRKSGSM